MERFSPLGLLENRFVVRWVLLNFLKKSDVNYWAYESNSTSKINFTCDLVKGF